MHDSCDPMLTKQNRKVPLICYVITVMAQIATVIKTHLRGV